MSWNNEIKDAQYTSPSGRTFTFQYGPLSKETELKTATFTFPEKDGALVVPLGIGGKTFPLACFFYGENCLQEANDFENGLMERGYGELQHPIYGVHKVVPTGSIKRSDDLVQGLNVSQVDVTFAETIIDETFPDSAILNQDAVTAKVDAFNEASVKEFVKNMNPENVSESLKVQGTLKAQTRAIEDNIIPLAKQSVSTYTRFQEIDENLKANIPSLSEKKEEIAQQALKLIELSSKLPTPVATKTDAYNSLAEKIINDFKNDPAGINAVKNQFICTRLILCSTLVSLASGIALALDSNGEIDSPASASAVGVTNSSSNPGRFKSRDEAVACAVYLSNMYDSVVDFLDSKIDEDLIVETGESFVAMHDCVALSIKLIVEQSFNLTSRKKITLGKDRQIMELLAELYGNFDRLDEFIVDNNLTYDEIQLIPMGREVAYYV